MSTSNEYQHWNIVDVRGADGLFKLGRVVDCAVEGLMIDFRCGAAAELVPFGQVYHRKLDLYNGCRAIEQQASLVDVLIRLSSKEPAKWYPGILLMGDCTAHRAFALVRATTPSGTLVEIVPATHVRQGYNEERLAQFLLRKGQFIKEKIQLPSGVSGGSPSPGPYKSASVDQHLVDCFNENCLDEWKMATHIDGGVLHVVKASDRYRQKFVVSIYDYYPNRNPESKGEELLRMLGVTSGAPADGAQQKRSSDADEWMSASKKFMTEAVSLPSGDCHDLSKVSTLQCLPSVSTLDQSSDFRVHGTESLSDACTVEVPMSINKVLPKELLAELFSFLDGTVQVRLRRVCNKWSDILSALPVTHMLRLSEEENSIVPHVCLLKRWTAQTKIIIKTNLENLRNRGNGKRVYDPLMGSGRLFHLIMQEHHLPRLETLVLVRISWEWYSSTSFLDFGKFVTHMCQELNLLASVCHSLVLKDITVVLWKQNAVVLHLGPAAVVRIIRGRIEGELSVESLWQRIDSSLPPLTDRDVVRWNERIAVGLRGDFAERLVEILNTCQSADPRNGNQFSGMEWTSEDLADLDLKKLSRVTAHSLLKACYREKLVLVLAW